MCNQDIFLNGFDREIIKPQPIRFGGSEVYASFTRRLCLSLGSVSRTCEDLVAQTTHQVRDNFRARVTQRIAPPFPPGKLGRLPEKKKRVATPFFATG